MDPDMEEMVLMYQPNRGYHLYQDKVTDLRRPRRDLPSPGQIIWDDIGDCDLTETMSWSQSDVERIIECWDQRLRDADDLCRRADIIHYDESDDASMSQASLKESEYEDQDPGTHPVPVTYGPYNHEDRQSSTPCWLWPTSAIFWLGMLVVVLVGGAVGVTFPYALSTDHDILNQHIQMATAILKQVPLIDGHNDLRWNIRKFLADKLKDLNGDEDLGSPEPWSKAAKQGGLISAQFWALYVPCEAQYKDAVQLSFEQVDVIRRLTERYQPDLTLCTSSKDIEAAHRKGNLCSVMGVEGGHTMGSSLPILRSLYDVGVRYLTLTGTCSTPWAGPSGGLTNFGRSVVREMNRLGMVVDLSYVPEVTMEAALNVTRAPIIVSHALCNGSRSVSDNVLRLVAANDGVIIINLFSRLQKCRQIASIRETIGHIEHVENVAGAEHVALGAGRDGINIAVFAELVAAGWSEDRIQQLGGLNLLRVLRRVEDVRDEMLRAGVRPSEDVIAPRLLAAHSNCTLNSLF